MPDSPRLPTGGASLAGRERERYVRALFGRIATPYDRLNRHLSLGRDQAWRRRVVDLLELAPGARVCDVGTGTGDLAIAVARTVGPDARVVGVDLARPMLRIAAAKRDAEGLGGVRFAVASAQDLPLAGDSTDALCMGWVLRNVGDRPAVYREVRRVLRPGGRFVSVDMSRPESLPVRAGFWLYRHAAMPVLARLSGGEAGAYRYLATSIDSFPAARELAGELRDAGFQDVRYEPLMMGSLALHVAVR